MSLLIATEGRWRSFSGPDLSETHSFKRHRLRVRSDEIVFDDACVRTSGRGAADQEIGASRRTGRGHPPAARSAEWLEARDLAELGAVTMMFGALQVKGRPAIERGAAGENLHRTAVRKFAHHDPLGAAERAGQPTRGQRNAAPIIIAERNEKGSNHRLIGRRYAAGIGLPNWLQQREGEHFNPRLDARVGRSDDNLAAGRKVHKARGDAYAGPILAVGFERREQRWPGA